MYNQETWRDLFAGGGDAGKEALCIFADDVTQFYVSQLLSENHQVREAACYAATELFSRIAREYNSEAFRKHALTFAK